jgi:catechol 2,3-dioxygenase-like lactoylglutathione lyase family enzyme
MRAGSSVVFLPCSDIRKTVSFYHDLLNLPIDQKQGDSLYIFDTGYGYWGFCQYQDGRKPLSGPQGVCLSLNLKDDEEVRNRYEELKDRCDVYRGPQKHPQFPVYSFFISDPDGYLVEFQNVYAEE